MRLGIGLACVLALGTFGCSPGGGSDPTRDGSVADGETDRPPMADADGYVTKSNVSLVMEMADMREANRTYEANLNSFQQARTMYRSLLDILRR